MPKTPKPETPKAPDPPNPLPLDPDTVVDGIRPARFMPDLWGPLKPVPGGVPGEVYMP